MRLLVLGINYWPEETGIAAFTTGRCEFLAAQGHDVTVCTAFPFYPQWRVYNQYRGRLFACGARRGVTIFRSWLYVPRRVTARRRVLHEASFVVGCCLRAFAGRRPDLLLVVSPPLGLTLPALLLSRWWRIPYVFHVADLQPDAAVDLGMLRPGCLVRALYAVEGLAYKRAAVVSTLTEGMRARILAKGVPHRRVKLFSDWAAPELFALPLLRGGNGFRKAAGLEDTFLVVHVGNMGVKQGLGVALEAARRSAGAKNLAYLLVGGGAERPALEAQAKALGLSNVFFIPLLPRRDFLDLLAATDVSLVTQQRTVADIVFPSKVLTLLAAGRPVIASVNAGSEVARVVQEAGAGVVVSPEDPDSLLKAVTLLQADPARRRAMGEAGRAYARTHWGRERILRNMEAELCAAAARGQPVERTGAYSAR